MQRTTNNGHVNPSRFCEECDNAIIDDAHHHDGDLLCPPCWAERRAEDARTELEEAETEIQDAADALEERRREYEQALAELDCEYSEDLAELRRRMQTWQRRANAASKRLRELGSIAAAVGAPGEPTESPIPLPPSLPSLPSCSDGEGDRSIPAGAVLVPPELEGLAPVCGGGADFTPTDDDWSDYRSWAEACDRREAFEEPEPEQPLWGYEA